MTAGADRQPAGALLRSFIRPLGYPEPSQQFLWLVRPIAGWLTDCTWLTGTGLDSFKPRSGSQKNVTYTWSPQGWPAIQASNQDQSKQQPKQAFFFKNSPLLIIGRAPLPSNLGISIPCCISRPDSLFTASGPFPKSNPETVFFKKLVGRLLLAAYMPVGPSGHSHLILSVIPSNPVLGPTKTIVLSLLSVLLLPPSCWMND